MRSNNLKSYQMKITEKLLDSVKSARKTYFETLKRCSISQQNTDRHFKQWLLSNEDICSFKIMRFLHLIGKRKKAAI